MNIDKYKELIQDINAIKLNEGPALFEYTEEQILIAFCFDHTKSLDRKKRIFLSVIRNENLLVGLEADRIKSKTLLLVNYLTPLYACAFELTIDRNKKSVTILLQDVPQLGENLVTKEEREGIEVYYA
jgi:hypothetical protein